MATERFVASRWTRGNRLFPTVIEITDTALIRSKRSWLSRDEMTIHLHRIASVHVEAGLIWADLLIESTGGSDPVRSHGHRKADARRIQELVEAAQSRLGAGAAGEAGPTKACPFCAETIKAAARVCRFCGRDLPGAVG